MDWIVCVMKTYTYMCSTVSLGESGLFLEGAVADIRATIYVSPCTYHMKLCIECGEESGQKCMR